MKRLGFLLGVLVLSCAHESPSKQAISATSTQAVSPAVDTSEPFEIVRIDDAFDPFASITDDRVPFGVGAAIYQEVVPLGVKHFGVDHFARLIPRDHESWQQNASRFLEWIDPAVPLPKGTRFGFEDITNYDRETKLTTTIGLRTYLLSGDPILTHRDVVDANVVEGDEDVPEISIAMKLAPAGARKLQTATNEWAFRRLAISSHGKIEAAPVVKAEIDDGTLQLVVGPRSDAIVARAKKLAEEMLQK